MFMNGNQVTYIGPNFQQQNTRRAVCVSDEYEIRGVTFVNIEFEGSWVKKKYEDGDNWHPANVENLEHRTY